MYPILIPIYALLFSYQSHSQLIWNGEMVDWPYETIKSQHLNKTLNIDYSYPIRPEDVKALKCNVSSGITRIYGYVDNPVNTTSAPSNITSKPLKDNVYKCFNSPYCNEYIDLGIDIHPEFLQISLSDSDCKGTIVDVLEEYGDTFKINDAIVKYKNENDLELVKKLEYTMSNIRENIYNISLLSSADHINGFIKDHSSIRKLSIVLGASEYLETCIEHLLSGIDNIDTLIIIEENTSTSQSPVKQFKIPKLFAGDFFNRTTFLCIVSNSIKMVPIDFYRKKDIPLQTLFYFCDSLESLESLTRLYGLQQLEIWNLKTKVDYSFIFTIPQLKHLGIRGSSITELSEDILKLEQLEVLELEYNKTLKHFPESVFCLPRLRMISLNENEKLKRFQRHINKKIKNKKGNCIINWEIVIKSNTTYKLKL